MNKLTVSLITVVRNGGNAFERAARSVCAQSYRPIDYIVIDGGSTDGTVDVIRSFGDRIAHWISEPDRGISHAFNKGINASTGHYIGFVNADDWLEPDYVEQAVHALESRNADFVFGDLAYHAADGSLLHVIEGDPDYAASIESLMPALNHPTMLARRSVFDGIGGFDERYEIAMDYDWALRAHLAGYRGRHVSDILGHMTLEGVSDRKISEGTDRGQKDRHASWPIRCEVMAAFRLSRDQRPGATGDAAPCAILALRRFARMDQSRISCAVCQHRLSFQSRALPLIDEAARFTKGRCERWRRA